MKIEFDELTGVAMLEPEGSLTEADFEKAKTMLDPIIEQRGNLHGLVIHTRNFPGWDSFGALVQHLKFVNDHHKKVKKIAFATDSAIGDLAERVGSHFIAAEIRDFKYDSLEQARTWAAQT